MIFLLKTGHGGAIGTILERIERQAESASMFGFLRRRGAARRKKAIESGE